MRSIVAFVAGMFLPQVVLCSPYSDPQCSPGRETIVHLFEWKWTDIEAECERFLGPYGYCGVQISPPNENAIVNNPNRPWYERYQPVSYNLVTRSGNEQQFKDMVNACNNVGVRIYVDAVINHMTGTFSGTGTGGNDFDGSTCSFPGVPYSSWDCNGPDMCPTNDGSIHSYGNPIEVRNCRLLTLADLRLSKDYVRGKIVQYLNHLIDIGVAGFRIDAAKHMWPGDLEIIFGQLNNLTNDVHGSGKRPFIFQEVIDFGGEPIKMSEYFDTGRVTNFIYGVKLSNIFLWHDDQAKWLGNWGEAWGMPKSDDVVVFINNHDNQRGHGVGDEPITFFHHKQLKIATAFMLAHPYGLPRIMSSYRWNRHSSEFPIWITSGDNKKAEIQTNICHSLYGVPLGPSFFCYVWIGNYTYAIYLRKCFVHTPFYFGAVTRLSFADFKRVILYRHKDWEGPPHNSDMSIKDVLVNSDMTCGNDWVCEHRWRQIYNMVAFRNVVAGTSVANFRSYGDQQISFSRGNKGFIALVGDNSSLNQNINTGLPSGDYCDVISGNYENDTCTGKVISIDANGNTYVNIHGTSENPLIAVHIGAKIGSPKIITTP